MRRVDASAGSVRLREALRTLRVKWEQSHSDWNDVVRREFEERYLEPLDPHVMATVNSMANLLQVLAKVEKDCS
jgi:hypothetical protein